MVPRSGTVIMVSATAPQWLLSGDQGVSAALQHGVSISSRFINFT